MKRIATLLFLLASFLSGPAQRALTPNPWFDVGPVPNSLGAGSLVKSCFLVEGGGTPDYFKFNPWVPEVSTPMNTYGIQADTLGGDGYIGMMFGGSEGQEYLGIRLCEPTVIGNRYAVSITVSLADNSGYSSDNLSISVAGQHIRPKLSGFKIDYPNKWQTFTDTIIADEALDFAYVGSFVRNSELIPASGGEPWCYVYVAGFSVIDLDSPSVICTSTNSYLGYSLLSCHNLLGQLVASNSKGFTVETYKTPKGEIASQKFIRK